MTTLLEEYVDLGGEGVHRDPAYRIPGEQPAFAFLCRHVRGLELRDVRVEFEKADRRAALICEDVEGLVTGGFEVKRISGGAPSHIVR